MISPIPKEVRAWYEDGMKETCGSNYLFIVKFIIQEFWKLPQKFDETWQDLIMTFAFPENSDQVRFFYT